MANYPMSQKVLVLDQVDRDQLEQIIEAYQMPPSTRIREALIAAFKIGYEQRDLKAR